MSVPGWYPDPGGASGQFRYWDGSTWSSETSPDPNGGAPGGKGRGKPPVGLIIGIVAGIAAIALIAVFLVPGLFNGNSTVADGPVDTSTPTGSSWDETSKPTTPPPSGPSNTPSTPQPSGGTEVICPVGNPNLRTSANQSGKLTGGGLVVNQIPAWRVDSAPMGLSFAYDVQSQTKSITLGWASNVAVGALKKSDGYTDVKQAADMTMQCLASSGFYTGFQRREDLVTESKTISGHAAYRIKSNIYVTGQGSIKGDVVDIIVVDTGNADYFGVYFGIATIDDRWVPYVDAVTASLRVG